MARPQKPHQPSFGGDPIPGLYHCPDGRWRINATGEKYTCHDERQAIARFLAWKESQGVGMVKLAVDPKSDPKPLEPKAEINGQATSLDSAAFVAGLLPEAERLGIQPAVRISANYNVPKAILMAWLRGELLDPAKLSQLAHDVGIPELAGLKHFQLPQEPIRVQTLLDSYREHSPATDRSKAAAIAAFNRLVDFCNAKTLEDFTQEQLLQFRQSIEADPDLKSAGTKRAYYGRVKSVIAFGLKVGLEATQLRATLDRAKVLWTKEAVPGVDPKPISRADLHQLLKTAGNSQWRAIILLALNMAMTIEDILELRWEDFKLEAGTYAEYRVKTRNKRVPRIACLWPETLAELQSLPRKSEFVFTSNTGTRYNRSTKYNDFADLARKAELPHVQFSHIRDGAYSIACNHSTINPLSERSNLAVSPIWNVDPRTGFSTSYRQRF